MYSVKEDLCERGRGFAPRSAGRGVVRCAGRDAAVGSGWFGDPVNPRALQVS